MLSLQVAGQDRITLVVSIHTLFHALAQHALTIGGKQAVPSTTPDDFDHIPTRSSEGRLKFLDDLAVASYRAVQAL